jgi:hypothetical protein
MIMLLPHSIIDKGLVTKKTNKIVLAQLGSKIKHMLVKFTFLVT